MGKSFLKPMTRQQLAREMGISTKTLNKWIKDSGFRLKSGLIKPCDVSAIRELLGYNPSNMDGIEKM